MEDTTIVAIAGIGGTAVVGLLIAYLNHYLIDRRAREERRLEAGQKALGCIEKLLFPLNECIGGYGFPSKDELLPLWREAKEFYHSHYIYLDKQSRIDMKAAIYSTKSFLEEFDDSSMRTAFDKLREAQKTIEDNFGG